MGRFVCACCGDEYHDRRFFWETESFGPQEEGNKCPPTEEFGDKGCAPALTKEECIGPVPGSSFARRAVPSGGIRRPSKHDRLIRAQEDRNESSPKEKAGNKKFDPAPTEEEEEGTAFQDEWWRFLWPLEGSNEPPPTEEAGNKGLDPAPTEEEEEEGTAFQDEWRTRADVARASGTAANWTGIAAPAAHGLLGPISFVGGLVGAAMGAMQLQQGLTMPSSEVDPHLVTKGGVTAGVGGACMVLGACATMAPPLFFVAAGLGVTGLVAATAIDANMAGLCPRCRVEAGRAQRKGYPPPDVQPQEPLPASAEVSDALQEA